jgi:predicted Zn finger-like uncharacterized protein
MIISCPSCGASFNVKAEALGSSGRNVKCSKCTHQWHALPDGADAPAAPTESTATAAPAAAAPPPPKPESPAAEADAEQVVADATPDCAADSAPDTDDDAPAPEPTQSESNVPEAAQPETAQPEAEQPEAEQPEAEQPEAAQPEAAQPEAAQSEAEPMADQEPDIVPALRETEFEDDPLPKLNIPDMLTAGDESESPPPEGDAEAPAPEPASKPAPGKAAGTGRHLARKITLSALAAAAAVIILAGGAVFLQPQITGMVPAAASLYAKMGLEMDIPGLGLKIVEPKPSKRVEGDTEILEVVGEIRNETEKPMPIPAMQARLLDGDGKPLEVWQFRATKSQIAPGESVGYKTEFRNPPNKAERLDITFTRQESATRGRPELARGHPPQSKGQPVEKIQPKEKKSKP